MCTNHLLQEYPILRESVTEDVPMMKVLVNCQIFPNTYIEHYEQIDNIFFPENKI